MSQTPSPATFTFAGTVRRPRTSNVPEVPSAENTYVVGIDQVLAAPPTLADVTGDITVQLPDDVRLDEGERRTFACVGWVLGQGIAVRAVEITDVGEQPPDVAAAKSTSDQLSSRVVSADLIISGVVSDVRNLDLPSGRISEHDPDWHEAIVMVNAVRKGTPPATDVVVTFPLSRDITWHDAPKFTVGQRGVFLLHTAADVDLPKGDAAALSARPYPTFTALDPLDVLAETEEEQVTFLTDQGGTP